MSADIAISVDGYGHLISYSPPILIYCSSNYKIMIPLPPKIDPSVTMMQVEERPSVTYADVGGCKEQIEKLREVVELPLLEVSQSQSTYFSHSLIYRHPA